MNNFILGKEHLCNKCNKNPRIVGGYFCPPCGKELKAELEADLLKARHKLGGLQAKKIHI